jgi:2-oxoglutarate ferredoxin oxidoreductase subunit beta
VIAVAHHTFLAEPARLPYCEGCSHVPVLRALDQALVALALDPHDVAIVTDIGCVGFASDLFDAPHTIHTLHGRSPATATGLALADEALGAGKLKAVVLIGDGGASVGIAHLVHAALINADVTVLVHNNSLFGLSGGQAAALAPEGIVTPGAAAGSFTPPLDIVKLLAAAQAGFLARTYADDPTLAATIETAVDHTGFALVEILEYCPARAVQREAVRGLRLEETPAARGRKVEPARTERAPFVETYRARHAAVPTEPPRPVLATTYKATLDRPMAIVVAGTAGEHVQTAAHLLCAAAVTAELDCTQKNDNPVTVGGGFSLSEVILSPFPISYTGIECPDAIIVTSDEGLAEVRRRGLLARLAPGGTVIAERGLAVRDALSFPLRKVAGPQNASLAGVFAWLAQVRILPLEALVAAARARGLNATVERVISAVGNVPRRASRGRARR